MNKKKISKSIFFGLVLGVVMPIGIQASQTNSLPSGWSSDSHTLLVSRVHEIKSFLFSTPVLIGAIFAFAMAIYHTFREGSVMPLLTVVGIIILASLAPLILDIVQPANAVGMVLDSLEQISNVPLVNN